MDTHFKVSGKITYPPKEKILEICRKQFRGSSKSKVFEKNAIVLTAFPEGWSG